MHTGPKAFMRGVMLFALASVILPGGIAPAAAEERVDPASLIFESSAEQVRFEALRACAALEAKGPGWNHIPMRVLGNFVEEEWCRGPGCDASGQSGVAREQRGAEWYQLSLLHYPREWPRVFGLVVSAGMNPREGAWGVHFYFSEHGKSVVGEGFGLTFHLFRVDALVQKISLGDDYAYEIGASTVRVRAPGGAEAELARLTSSPASLRATAKARYAELLREVEKALREHRVKKYVDGPYLGEGIPPVRTEVAMSAAEERLAVAKARREIGDMQKAIAASAAAWHLLMGELMSFDRCWK